MVNTCYTFILPPDLQFIYYQYVISDLKQQRDVTDRKGMFHDMLDCKMQRRDTTSPEYINEYISSTLMLHIAGAI